MIVSIYYWFRDKREHPLAFGQPFSILGAAEGKTTIELCQLFRFIVQSIDVLSDFILLLPPQAWEQSSSSVILLIESHACALTQKFSLVFRCTTRQCFQPFHNQEGPHAFVLTDRIEWVWTGSEFSLGHTSLNSHMKTTLLIWFTPIRTIYEWKILVVLKYYISGLHF